MRKIKRFFRRITILICLVILALLLGVVYILGTGGTGTLQENPGKKPSSASGLFDILTGNRVKETEEMTFGVDVAKYQGTIDWAAVADSGVDFVMVRLGYRGLEDGIIVEDSNAAYNLQQAQKHGLKLGAYFFSTAVTREEAIEEADWVADFLAPYPITYPVAYNCEGFNDAANRQFGMAKSLRTDMALAFLKQIEKRGYEGMFYASRNEMTDDAQWQVSRIDPDYKVWVAQYPEKPYPETAESSYEGIHQMWQYTRAGTVPGIPEPVDMNAAYFGYESTAKPQSDEVPPEAKPDPEALMEFTASDEEVTAKSETNLRSIPSQGEDAKVLYTLKNGEIARRIGISDSGWSKVEFEGNIYYAVTSYLTTNLDSSPEPEPTEDDGIDTEFRSVSESVTAKEWVNLRKLPSTTMAEAVVVRKLENGQIATRTGISDNGWSRLEIDGQILYCVSSYLTTDVGGSGTEDTHEPGIQTQFKEVSETVTAKDKVNLRTLPSTTDPDCEIVTQLKHGDTALRTGINEDVGWSRVEYQGQVLYCVSSYLEVVE